MHIAIAMKWLTFLSAIIIFFSNCKKPMPKEQTAEITWQPNIKFAEFMTQITKECTKGKPAIAEFKNPGFTEIIMTEQYMPLLDNEFTELSPVLRARIDNEIPREMGRYGKVYFIKNHDTVVMELEAGELPCTFDSPRGTLGQTIFGVNRKAFTQR